MAEVAKFCRERQALCHRAVIVPQVALLYSRASHYRQSPQLFTPNSPAVRSLRGVLQGLVESQDCVQIVSEHHLRGHMAEWPLIVLPECEYLDSNFRDELVDYVRRGGRLLVVGPKAAAQFVKELDVVPDAAEPVKATVRLEHRANKADFATTWHGVKPGSTARSFGAFHPADDTNGPARPAATLTPLGKGTIAATWLNLGERCADGKTPAARDFLDALVRELFPTPIVAVIRMMSTSRSRSGVTCRFTGQHFRSACHGAVRGHHHACGALQVTLRSGSPETHHAEPGARSLEFIRQRRDACCGRGADSQRNCGGMIQWPLSILHRSLNASLASVACGWMNPSGRTRLSDV